MGSKDTFDMELAARQGLEKLGYTQEMTRVRIVPEFRFLCLVQEILIDASSAHSRVACSTFFSVSSIQPVAFRCCVHYSLSSVVCSDTRFV